MSKRAEHAVRAAEGHFEVTSGRSGQVYRVTPYGGQDATCSCEGYRWSQKSCSHIRAVIAFAKEIMYESVDPFRRIK